MVLTSEKLTDEPVAWLYRLKATTQKNSEMTHEELRDQMAMAALPLAADDWKRMTAGEARRLGFDLTGPEAASRRKRHGLLALVAYEIADSMMEARSLLTKLEKPHDH